MKKKFTAFETVAKMCVYIAGGDKTRALRECRSPTRL